MLAVSIWRDTLTRFKLYNAVRVKIVRGSLHTLVNTSWATNITVHETDCSSRYAVMKALFRTDYLICQKITIIKVHVPGPDYALAAVHIEQPLCRLVSLCGDLDRFDDCTQVLNHVLHIKQDTTKERTKNRSPEQCFGNEERGLSFNIPLDGWVIMLFTFYQIIASYLRQR